jgi:hypothetical protein
VPVLLRVTIDPAPAAIPDIVLSASGGAENHRELDSSFFNQLAAADEIFVKRSSASGPFTIS